MKKIMFNDRFLLTQAVLEGRKTQTRRIITPQPYYDNNVGMVWKGYMYGRGLSDFEEPQASYRNFVHDSRYKVNEIVAVAQSYGQVYADMIIDFAEHSYHLPREDSAEKFRKEYEQTKGWTNKMFVRSEACSHQIRITKVRVQRLQDITDDECLLEGIYLYQDSEKFVATINDTKEEERYRIFDTVRDAYAFMIDALSGKGTWESNPYVFVYGFELI